MYKSNYDKNDHVKSLVFNKYILPFNKNNNNVKNVGTELEFPILNLSKKPLDLNVINRLMEHVLEAGFNFRIIRYDIKGNIAGLINDAGDVISFDNSFNNIEFSMSKASLISSLADKFYLYIDYIQEFLIKNNYIISGFGTNPYKKYINDSPVKIEIYNAIRSYLGGTQGYKYHQYHFFPPYMSSAQTHIDIAGSDLIKAFNLFSRLDFVRAYLFSNALPFHDSGSSFSNFINFRDYLWEKSGFSYNPLNVGKNDTVFISVEQIIDDYLKRSIFMKSRDGNYFSFIPVPIEKYFSNPIYNSIDEDINTFITFRTVELTFRGTIEIRSDCSQPLYEAFAPAAFNQGLSFCINEADTLCKGFFEENKIMLSNSQMRNLVVSGNIIPSVSDRKISRFILDLIEVAYKGLIDNSPGDEIYLKPLIDRAETLSCPAKNTKRLLSHGQTTETIIKNYARLK